MTKVKKISKNRHEFPANQKGFGLAEVVVSIVILGVASFATMLVFVNSATAIKDTNYIEMADKLVRSALEIETACSDMESTEGIISSSALPESARYKIVNGQPEMLEDTEDPDLAQLEIQILSTPQAVGTLVDYQVSAFKVKGTQRVATLFAFNTALDNSGGGSSCEGIGGTGTPI